MNPYRPVTNAKRDVGRQFAVDLEKLNLRVVKMTHTHTKKQANHMNRGPTAGSLGLAHLVRW